MFYLTHAISFSMRTLFTPWLTIDSRRTPDPAGRIPCQVCPEEGGAMALLIDPGIEEDCAIYGCERDAGHVMAYPHSLDWPSFRARTWFMNQEVCIRAFFSCTLPWCLRRAWRKVADSLFLTLSRLAHACMHWSSAAMRRDHQGAIIRHILRSRGIAALGTLLFAATMPHMEKRCKDRRLCRKRW